MTWTIRTEKPTDIAGIRAVTEAAFKDAAHSSHTEHYIVDALRERGELVVSQVAVRDGQVIGHVAVSPVAISDGSAGWFGLGPISVAPSHQGQGVGTAFMQAALDALRAIGARGCVLLGEPAYYGRFGFRCVPDLALPGVPGEYFQALLLQAPMPRGEVSYSPAFEAGPPG